MSQISFGKSNAILLYVYGKHTYIHACINMIYGNLQIIYFYKLDLSYYFTLCFKYSIEILEILTSTFLQYIKV